MPVNGSATGNGWNQPATAGIVHSERFTLAANLTQALQFVRIEGMSRVGLLIEQYSGSSAEIIPNVRINNNNTRYPAFLMPGGAGQRRDYREYRAVGHEFTVLVGSSPIDAIDIEVTIMVFA